MHSLRNQKLASDLLVHKVNNQYVNIHIIKCYEATSLL